MLAQFAQLVEGSKNMIKSAVKLQGFSGAFKSLLSLLNIVVFVRDYTLQMRGDHITHWVCVQLFDLFTSLESVLTIGLSCLHSGACLFIPFLFKHAVFYLFLWLTALYITFF